MPVPTDFVTIKTLDDPVQAEMIRDVLDQAGIHASTQGAEHRGLLGMAGAFIQIPIQVPADRAEEALELIAALDHPDAVVADEDQEHLQESDAADDLPADQVGEGPYRASTARGSTESPRLWRVAAFCSLVLTFGTGHFYARENIAGLVLLLAELLTIGLSMVVQPAAGLAVVGLVLVDLVGSARAVRRTNSQQRRSRAAQAGVTALWSAACIVSAVVFGPDLLMRLEPPVPETELFYPTIPQPYPYPEDPDQQPLDDQEMQDLLDMFDRGGQLTLPVAPVDPASEPASQEEPEGVPAGAGSEPGSP